MFWYYVFRAQRDRLPLHFLAISSPCFAHFEKIYTQITGKHSMMRGIVIANSIRSKVRFLILDYVFKLYACIHL